MLNPKTYQFNVTVMVLCMIAGGFSPAGVAAKEVSESKHNIVQLAAGAGTFDTLATALDAAGLLATFQFEGPYTIFAPTDEAFSRLPAGTVEYLLKPENRELLTEILTYHVVPGRVTAEQVVRLKSATTVNGQSVGIETNGARVMVGNARVINVDLLADNGIVHVIDTVLIPGG